MDLSRITTGKRFRIGRVGKIPIFITLWLAILGGYWIFKALIYDARPDHVLWIAILFMSIFLHELGHAAAARRCGHRIEGITFHLFGGLMEHVGSSTARQGALITIAGPAVNLILLLVALALMALFPEAGRWGDAAIGALHMLNLILLIFNILPIYPLDGGQLSRLVLSKYFGPVRGVVIGSVLALVAVVACFGFLMYRGFGGLLGILLLTMLGLSNYDELEKHRAIERSLGLPPISPWAPFRRLRRRLRLRSLRKCEVTDLLDKASREGIASLTPEERRAFTLSRHDLDLRVAKVGYGALSKEEQTLLDVHHLLETRNSIRH